MPASPLFGGFAMDDLLAPDPVKPAQSSGFDDLLWDLFLQLMDIPADRVHAEILDAQRRICRALDLDRSSLWQTVPEDVADLRITHLYDAEHDSIAAPSVDGSVPGERGLEFRAADDAVKRYALASSHFPRLAKRVLRGETTVIDSVDDIPADAAEDAAELRRLGTASSVIVPLEANGAILGCVTFATVHRRRRWPSDLVSRFERIGQVFAKALARERTDELLRDREARLELAVGSAGAGVWDLDLATGHFRVTEIGRGLFGFSAADDIDVRKVLEIVHPADRQLIRDRIARARLHPEAFSLEYRVVLPDGSVRWLHTRGRPHQGPDGTTDRVLGVTIDVTDRRTAEELVHEGRARLAAAVDVAALGCFELKGSTRHLFADGRMHELLGVEETARPEDLWRFWIDHVHAEDRPRVAELSRRMREEGLDSVVTEYRYEHPRLGVRWFSHASRVLERTADGRLERLVGVMHDVTEAKSAEEALRRSLAEVADLKDRLEAENVMLHREVRHVQGFESIVGRSAALGRVLIQVEQVAPTDSPVLLLGETGTGKDLVARALHERSRRSERPMVTVNCAALPASLIESELFGYERGAFTGAMQRSVGRFEVADRGTIFLDEIGELPLEVQAKLLRVLQSGEFERLGSPRTIKVNVRLIAATNRDLDREMREGRFRSDLYYRLSVFPVILPPLRDRPEDIPVLVWHFISRKQTQLGRSIKRISAPVMRALCAYAWPGNVRELENLVERALILSQDNTLAADPVLFTSSAEKLHPSGGGTLEEVERAYIRAVLAECKWKVSGAGNAAERLGLTRSTLQFRMKKLGIERPARET